MQGHKYKKWWISSTEYSLLWPYPQMHLTQWSLVDYPKTVNRREKISHRLSNKVPAICGNVLKGCGSTDSPQHSWRKPTIVTPKAQIRSWRGHTTWPNVTQLESCLYSTILSEGTWIDACPQLVLGLTFSPVIISLTLTMIVICWLQSHTWTWLSRVKQWATVLVFPQI